jgi:Icc-related predicted phosphoesterase
VSPVTSSTIAHRVSWPLPDPERILVAGDWHGNARAAAIVIDAAAHLDIPVIVQLGDFGLWPGQEGARYLSELEACASEAGVLIAWVDGNHEDFTQLAAIPVESDGLQWNSPHVVHIPRGSRWSWRKVRFAALGGATSLDRLQRTPGKSWWMEESVNDNDLAVLAAGGNCDVLLTHDCPTGVNIPGVKHRDYGAAVHSGWPLGELEIAWDHRDRLLEAVRSVKPRHLWHGHFHVRHSQVVALHDAAPTRVEGLSWDGDALSTRVLVAQLSQGNVKVSDLQRALELANKSDPAAGGPHE